MTVYTPADLAEHWEFKILRAATTRFSDPVKLTEILKEEARAQWTMVEKFDDSRIRLKRPVSARAGDAALDFDPYRIWVGIGQTRLALFVVFGAIVGVIGLVAAIFMIVSALGLGGHR